MLFTLLSINKKARSKTNFFAEERPFFSEKNRKDLFSLSKTFTLRTESPSIFLDQSDSASGVQNIMLIWKRDVKKFIRGHRLTIRLKKAILA